MKFLTRFLALALLLAFAGTLQAQITISETFDGLTFPPAGWVNGPSSWIRRTTNPVPCTGAGAAAANLYSTVPSRGLSSPVGTSNGQALTISFDYKLANFGGSVALLNSPAWGNISVQVSTDGGTTYPITAGTIDPTNHVVSTSCANRTYTVAAASVPNGNSVRVRFLGTWTSGDWNVIVDNVSIAQASLVPPPCATTPSPANGATAVSNSTSLSWAAAAGATSYDVYFGTVPAPPLVTTVAGTSYNPGPLVGGTTYYFQIIPKNVNGAAAGCTIWSFTTIGCPSGLGTGVTNVTLPYTVAGQTTCGQINDITSTNAAAVCGSSSYYLGEDRVYIFTPATTANYAVNMTTTTDDDAGMTLYQGCPVAGGTCVGISGVGFSQAATGLTRSLIAPLTAGVEYYLVVDNFTPPACITSFNLTIDLAPAAPNCATNFAPTGGPIILLCGPNPSSVVFTWNAPTTGPAPTGYKFYFGTGVPTLVTTVTTTTTTIFNLLPSTSYNWYVVPTNGGGDATGCAVPVTFTTGAEPACVVNNSCATATVIGVVGAPGSVSSTTTGATISRAPEVCASFTGDADDDVWFSFTTDSDGGNLTLALTAAAAALDAVIQVYSGTCGALTNIGCADAGASGGQNETVNLTALAASTTYYARVYGYGAFSSTTPTSGTFTLTTSGTALPLELKSFTGQAQAATNVLSWETLTEKNVQSHIVERSVDGTRWSEVGRVASKGDSQVSVKYALEDRTPLAKAYYRLRSVDFDGQESRSNSIVLTRKGEQFGITSVYPSPTNGNVTVQFNATSEEKVTVRVMDMTGRLVLEQYTESVQDINELPITLTSLQAGVYTVTVSNSTSVSTPVRFVKQ